MTSPNLVPKQITDKNGVTKKHWVRPDASSTLQKPLPAPVAAETVLEEREPQWTLDDALEVFRPDGGNSSDTSYKNLWFLAHHSQELLDRLLDQCADANLQALWERKIHKVKMTPYKDVPLENQLQLDDWERRLDIYPLGNELIHLVGDDGKNPGLLREHTGTLEVKVTSMLMWGTNLSNRDNREKPAPDLVKALALICIIRGAYDERCWRMNNDNLQYADIEEDAAYISQHVDEVKALVPELVQRKSHDTGLIREMLEGQSKSLTSGML